METLENPTASSPPSQTPESGVDENPSSAPSDRSDPGAEIQEGGARISDLESASADQGSLGAGSASAAGGIEDGGVRVSAEGAGDETGSGAAGSAVEGRAVELKDGDGDSSVAEGVSIRSGGEEGIGSGEAIVLEAKENEQSVNGEVLARQSGDDCQPQSNGACSGANVDTASGFQESSSGVEEGAPVEVMHTKESSSSGDAQPVAADACVAENGQDRTVDISEEVEKNEDAMMVEAPVSIVDKMQTVAGDADVRQQVAPEAVAIGREEVSGKENEVMEMGDSSISAEGKEGVASESSLPAVAQAVATDVCLAENGQDPKVLDEKQNTEGDVAGGGITSLDEEQQIKQEIGAVEREEGKVPEKAGISVSEKREGGLNNESGLRAPAPAIAADVSLPENGQGASAEAVESHTSVFENERAEVTEAAVVVADQEQKTGGDARDVGITVSDGKQQTVQQPGGGGEDVTSEGKKFSKESVFGHNNLSAGIEVAESDSSKVTIMDVCLPENGQEPGSEGAEVHIESDNLVLGEKQNSAGNVTVHGSDLSQKMQQTIPESVTGKGEQIAVEGNGTLGYGIACHQDSCTEIEATEPVSAPVAVPEGQIMDTHVMVLEMREVEGNELEKPLIELVGEKQNDTHDATVEVATSLEEQQSTMDVSLPENGQDPGVEVSEMHVESSASCLDEKQLAATVDGEQQVVKMSAASEIQQVTKEGGFSEDSAPGHDDANADIEVRKSPPAQDVAVDGCLAENAPASGDEVVETQLSVPEMAQTEEVEAVDDMKISATGDGTLDANQFLENSCLSEEKQSIIVEAKDVDDAADTDISFADEKGQQTVTKSISGEEEAAAEGNQSVEDGLLNRNNASTGVEAMEANVSLPGTEENEEEDEVEEDEEQADDEEDQFSVGDFVWGKIKSHPWWPGQIYDPSDASDFARKYRRRDRLLVAYFGDRTFAWCYPSQLRPFNRHFERMMKQSSTKSFLNAVEEALSELSRCVESEMTCSCVSEETKVRLAQPLAVNAGIKEGTTVPQGHIDELSINEFDRANFIGRLKDIAPVVAVRDTLELTVFKSRLSAFYGAKGYNELPTYHLPRGISDPEEDAKNLLPEEGQPGNLTDTPTEEDWTSPPVGPGAGKSCSSDKRSQVSEDKIYQRRKRSVAELMADHIDMEFVNDRHVKDEAAISDRPAASSKDHKKTKPSAASSAAEEEVSDIDKDVSDEGKSVGKSVSSSKRRKKGKHLDTSHSSLTENKASDVENDDAGEEAAKTTTKSAPSSKKRKNVKHSASSPSTTAENKVSDIENDDSGEEEVRTLDKSAPSSKTRKKSKCSDSSPPSSPDNKVTFDDEINDGVAEEGAVLCSPRNRRRSRYLSAPYTLLGGQKSLVSLEDSETGNAKATMVSRVGASISKIAVQLTGASQIVKSSGKKLQKKVSKEPNFEDKTPGTAGPQTTRRNRKTQALKEEDAAADEMVLDTLSTPSDSMQPKGGRKGKSSVPENDSSGNDPYELKFGEKRGKEKEQTSLKTPKRKSRKSSVEDTAPHSAALLLTFEPGFALPSKDVLMEVFSKYGALNESETEVMEGSGCAQVVFARSSDAEEAFNNSDKDTAFKPATVSYRLRYPSTASKVSEPDSPPSAAVDGNVAPQPTENLAETQPLLYMQQSIESMMSLLSKFTGKEPGQAAKLTPTVRADLTVELGCLLQKVTSLVEDPRS